MKKKGLLKALLACLILSLGFSSCELVQKERVSIVSIEKTATEGLVDTYTIYYSDGSEYSFEVTNGADGVDGKGCASVISIGSVAVLTLLGAAIVIRKKED